MAVLDLQGMKVKGPVSALSGRKSSTSKNCTNVGGGGGTHFSSLSLLIC